MRGLLAITVVLSFSATTPAFANWWVVRSSDETCLVVDIEPTGKEKGITKIGKDSYPTASRPKPIANHRLSRSGIPSFGEAEALSKIQV